VREGEPATDAASSLLEVTAELPRFAPTVVRTSVSTRPSEMVVK